MASSGRQSLFLEENGRLGAFNVVLRPSDILPGRARSRGRNDCGKLRYLDQAAALAAIARQRRECRGVPLLHAYGWAYLAGVMDACTRRIVGWALADPMPASLVVRVFERALVQRRPSPGLRHHSERGSQHASDAYRLPLHKHGVQTSMSRRANGYDNATMESFWATLKTELTDGRVFEDFTHARARSALFDYFEVFPNRKRLHGALGYTSPVEYETNLG